MNNNFRIAIGHGEEGMEYIDLGGSHYQNLIITGYPGAGKTTILYNIINNLIEDLNVEIKILDCGKNLRFNKYQSKVQVNSIDIDKEFEYAVDSFEELYKLMCARRIMFQENGWLTYAEIPQVWRRKIPRIVVIIGNMDMLFNAIKRDEHIEQSIHTNLEWLLRIGSTVGINYIVEGQALDYPMKRLLPYFRKGVLLRGNYRNDYEILQKWLDYMEDKEMINVEKMESMTMGEALMCDGDFRSVKKIKLYKRP